MTATCCDISNFNKPLVVLTITNFTFFPNPSIYTAGFSNPAGVAQRIRLPDMRRGTMNQVSALKANASATILRNLLDFPMRTQPCVSSVDCLAKNNDAGLFLLN